MRFIVASAFLIAVPGRLAAAPRDAGPRTQEPIFQLRSAGSDPVVVEWDRERTLAAARSGRPLKIARFPLRPDLAVDLELSPFSVTGPDTTFAIGRRGLPDLPIAFDPSTVSLFRGRVAGREGSHVLLAIADTGSTGFVDLGEGEPRYGIASRTVDGARLPAGTTQVFEVTAAVGAHPNVPYCGTDTAPTAPLVGPSRVSGRGPRITGAPRITGPPRIAGSSRVAAVAPRRAVGPSRGLMQLQIAVETDYEFFSLFGDTTSALTYLMQMYAAVSDIYMRDVDTRVEVAFARLWTTPDDLFNQVDPTPINEFRSWWNANMTGVTRDAAQLISGRRDYPFGGQAFVTALCTDDAYSVVGYILGAFPDPSQPSVYAYDVGVVAHELGHNAGTPHTQDLSPPVDQCHNPATVPQRGSIMSYCSQTWSGMNANEDHYFHARSQLPMDAHIGNASCIADDCNLNGRADSADISDGTSPDINGDHIPDECEDCNGNMVLDVYDITTLSSTDLNGNLIPDECEPDCNGNSVPDSRDISTGGSDDAYGDGIPDECEADCNLNGVSDYTEIQLSMPLDIDRDTILDACEDCDSDGAPDLADLDNAHFVWVASGLSSSSLRAFHAETGVRTDISSGGAGALASAAQDLIVAPGGRILVTSRDDSRVMMFDLSGTFQGNLVAPGAGGLAAPAGLTLAPDGSKLLVAGAGNRVLAYDPNTGAPLGDFVSPGSGGLTNPFGLTFGPNGNLYVTSSSQVLEFDGITGAFVRVFVSSADNGGLSQPRGIAFKRDGNLLVASFGGNEVLEFDGITGAALGRWARAGTPTILDQRSPWGVRVAPNGNIFVSRTGPAFGSPVSDDDEHDHEDTDIVDRETRDPGRREREREQGRERNRSRGELHLTNAQIYEYDGRNGNFLRTYIGGNDHGLSFPTGFDFVPGHAVDCNVNYRQDACDILSGSSQDADVNGVPDECEADCNDNGTPDRLDIIPDGLGLDCNGNLSPDACDLSLGVSQDCTGNGIPDECEPDCDLTGTADSCDIMLGTDSDCNGNGVPDFCDVTETFESNHGWIGGVAGDTATAGVWTRVDPVGTTAAPADDHTPGSGRACFVTGQGTVGGATGDADVDGGATTLRSPVFNLAGMDETEIGYWRWFSNNAGPAGGQDVLTVSISNNGGASWVAVETVGPSGPERMGGWFWHQFRVANLVTPSANTVLRFVVSDTGGDSTIEAAIDDVLVLAKTSAVPGEVQNLAVVQPAPTRLTWTTAGAGARYDVIGGSTLGLVPTGGVSGAQCLAGNTGSVLWDDERPDPPPGQAYYYLVRADKSCNAGTYGFATSGAERLPTADCP